MPRHRARPKQGGRRRALLAGTACLLVAAAAGGYLLARQPASHADSAASDTRAAADASHRHDGTAGPADSARPSASASARAKPAPSRSLPSPSVPRPSPAATAAALASAAASVFVVINHARAQAGLPPYTVLDDLDLSASRHDELMASGCGLSHQCPGEPSLGARETAAGVQWTAAGENIGEGGPVADTNAAITQMAVALTEDMLAEKPPDDGHRLNILSSSFTHIGIAVLRSANGTVWMTQDFAN